MTSPGADRNSFGAGGFTRLLERLHPDADQAALEYERLRAGLLKFFDWRGVWPPDECADEVFDRLARKLGETAVQDVGKYVYGIARLVALERRRGPVFSSIDDVSPAVLTAPAARNEGDGRQDCFERCLAALPEDSRALILKYYEGEQSVKISNRRRLASALGLTDNALRSRVQRIRERLERCVQGCVPEPVGHTS